MTDSSHLPRPSLVFPAKLPDLTQSDYDRYNFKQARLDRHMTQEQFGAALGITSSLVTKIERGERNVSDQVMHDLRKLPEAASGAGEREEWSFTPDTREAKVVAQLSEEQELSPQAVMRQALRLYQSDFLRRKAGETVTWSGDAQRARDFAGPLASLPPATDPAMVRKPKTAAELKAIIDDWLARDCDWGDWEKALDRLAKEDVSERSAVVAMLRADADTMRQNAEAYREESPADARALSEVATTLAIKAFQIERGDHLKETTAALAAAPTIPATWEAVPAGMKPWAGGDAAPDDLDLSGKVLREDGQTEAGRDVTIQQWKRPVPRCKWNIIAYTPKATIPATGHAATEGEGA